MFIISKGRKTKSGVIIREAIATTSWMVSPTSTRITSYRAMRSSEQALSIPAIESPARTCYMCSTPFNRILSFKKKFKIGATGLE
jgi:hypothetical protein